MRHQYHENCDGVVMIHKGLSVRICGCLISIEQDAGNNEARVVVDSKGILEFDLPALEAIRFQADLLCKRAARFYGITWQVHPWDGRVPIASVEGESRSAG